MWTLYFIPCKCNNLCVFVQLCFHQLQGCFDKIWEKMFDSPVMLAIVLTVTFAVQVYGYCNLQPQPLLYLGYISHFGGRDHVTAYCNHLITRFNQISLDNDSANFCRNQFIYIWSKGVLCNLFQLLLIIFTILMYRENKTSKVGTRRWWNGLIMAVWGSNLGLSSFIQIIYISDERSLSLPVGI